jgi:hypothetical protein
VHWGLATLPTSAERTLTLVGTVTAPGLDIALQQPSEGDCLLNLLLGGLASIHVGTTVSHLVGVFKAPVALDEKRPELRYVGSVPQLCVKRLDVVGVLLPFEVV